MNPRSKANVTRLTRHARARVADVREEFGGLTVGSNNPPVRITDSLSAGSVLSTEINAAIRAGDRISRIARRAGLNPGTVSKLYYGETKRPQFDTVVKLFHVFHYGITAQKE